MQTYYPFDYPGFGKKVFAIYKREFFINLYKKDYLKDFIFTLTGNENVSLHSEGFLIWFYCDLPCMNSSDLVIKKYKEERQKGRRLFLACEKSYEQ